MNLVMNGALGRMGRRIIALASEGDKEINDVADEGLALSS